ncbi:MAG: GAF domain-containing protein [Ectothiorhodospiraceae bacterium]|nr:GAF domain-containing protein [Ectothiorhodospiraceae bacterium]
MGATNGQHSPHLQEQLFTPKRDYEFPFKTTLSFHKVVELWNTDDGNPTSIRTLLVDRVNEELEKYPSFRGPIENVKDLDVPYDVAALFFGIVMSQAEKQHSLIGIYRPFMESVFTTPGYQRLFLANEGKRSYRSKVDDSTMSWGKAVMAYSAILEKFYGVDIAFEYPMINMVEDPDTGLTRWFKMEANSNYADIVLHGELPELSDEDIYQIRSNITDIDLLMELMPPERFEFQGFIIFRAVEVTDSEVLSELKRRLIDRESIVSGGHFAEMEDLLRSYLRAPDARLGLTVFHTDEDGGKPEYGSKLGNSFIFHSVENYSCDEFLTDVYEHICKIRDVVLVYDLQKKQNPGPVDEELLRQGVRNLCVIPLYADGTLIGMLELASETPGAIDGLKALKLREVVPLFITALQRNLDEMDNRIQALIKEKCTAIHPAVEWRFRRAALNQLNSPQAETGVIELEPIAFEEVYPLYGLSDIRNSSDKRNASIQEDLLAQLHLGRAIVECSQRAKAMPFLDKLVYQIRLLEERITDGLSSGDELEIYEFLHTEVEQLFPQLEQFSPEVHDHIVEYREALDPDLGVVYNKRKEFEESVMTITDTISTDMDYEQEKAQEVYPHYFERYKTDGVDHSLYVGASINRDEDFNLMYLKNFRLWQLMFTCRIAKKLEDIKPSLKVPLDVAHLILVQDNPLAIRFRYDEKHFDVDGAYNVRYEIMKKRIDKARVIGTHERLTQPGKIAIVYSQAKEAAEYMQYIKYLQSIEYIDDEIEDLEIEPLQGIQGLRALRVSVNQQFGEARQPIVDEAVATISRLQVQA